MKSFQILDPRNVPRKSIIVHASEGWFSAMERGEFDFFTKLAQKAGKEGFEVYYVDSESVLSQQILSETHVHIILGNRKRTSQNVLYAMPAYVWGF
jgi:hypothetical protein